MEEKEQFAPTEIVKDGKVTRRTFVKGAGWLTITSAIGASALGCAPAQKSESEDDKLAAELAVLENAEQIVERTSWPRPARWPIPRRASPTRALAAR